MVNFSKIIVLTLLGRELKSEKIIVMFSGNFALNFREFPLHSQVVYIKSQTICIKWAQPYKVSFAADLPSRLHSVKPAK